MRQHRIGLALMALALAACGSSGLSRQQLIETHSAIDATKEIGGHEHPDARLHLKYATDQLEAAQRLMEDGEEEDANHMLDRAQADAELALQIARTEVGRKQAEAAQEEIKTLQGDDQLQSAQPEPAQPEQPASAGRESSVTPEQERPESQPEALGESQFGDVPMEPGQ